MQSQECVQKAKCGFTEWRICTATHCTRATCRTRPTPLPLRWPKTVTKHMENTRPISLSCTAFKIFAQLLLARGRGHLTDTHGVQWAEQGKQTGEVIYALRRLSRIALDWGKPIFVLKLDIRKAFDCVVQARPGEYLVDRIARRRGMPWEALLWLQLVQCEELLIQTEHYSQTVKRSASGPTRLTSPVCGPHGRCNWGDSGNN